MRTFLEELKKRRVYRVAIAYAIAGSAIVQLAGTVFPIFHAPEWTQQVFVALVALGFPVALVLAWAFELEDGSITRTPGPSGPLAAANGRRVWVESKACLESDQCGAAGFALEVHIGDFQIQTGV